MHINTRGVINSKPSGLKIYHWKLKNIHGQSLISYSLYSMFPLYGMYG